MQKAEPTLSHSYIQRMYDSKQWHSQWPPGRYLWILGSHAVGLEIEGNNVTKPKHKDSGPVINYWL